MRTGRQCERPGDGERGRQEGGKGGREGGSKGEEGQREGRREQTTHIKQREQRGQIITIAHGAHNDHNNPPRTGFMELI